LKEALYRQRSLRGERLPGHDDLAMLGALRERLDSGLYKPPDLPVAILRIDTTVPAGYAPAVTEIVRFVQERLPGC
jgi:hypothetical protein